MTSEASFNPYEPPASEEEVRPLAAVGAPGAGFYRDGEFLVVRDGAVLPEVCLVAGEAAAADWEPPEWVTYTWTPRWIRWVSEWSWPVLMFMPLGYAYLSHRAAPILTSLWILPIGLLINRGEKWASRSVAVLCSVSPAVGREAQRDFWVHLVFWLPFSAGFMLLGMKDYRPGGVELWASQSGVMAVMGISQVIQLLIKAWRMRPAAVSYRDGWFRVRNCHPAFLNRLPEPMPAPGGARRPAPPVMPVV